MNRNASQLVQSNRPASRRLHRRPVHTPGVPYVAEANTFSCTPATVAGLPQSMVREAGMFELLAAEMRIAELEAELAEARVAAGIGDGLLRLSVGIEHVDDLLADLSDALARAQAAGADKRQAAR